MILLIDNYDSFVHNLARYFRRLGQETLVVRNDEISEDEIRRLAPQAIVISPGPCTPNEAGISITIIREFFDRLPLLGVCLGHQAIAAAFGSRIVRAAEPMHGRTSTVVHGGEGLFRGLLSPLAVCRYHSLVVEEATLPAELEITARAVDGTIMALEHTQYPVFGLQFHPEATLTQHGFHLLNNFLLLAGIPGESDTDSMALTEFGHNRAAQPALPARPVTF